MKFELWSKSSEDGIVLRVGVQNFYRSQFLSRVSSECLPAEKYGREGKKEEWKISESQNAEFLNCYCQFRIWL